MLICFDTSYFVRKREIVLVLTATMSIIIKQQYLHASYQSKIWRDCIADEFFVPPPEGHGWTITNGEINIKWMDCKPAPEEVSLVFFISDRYLRVTETNKSSKGLILF